MSPPPKEGSDTKDDGQQRTDDELREEVEQELKWKAKIVEAKRMVLERKKLEAEQKRKADETEVERLVVEKRGSKRSR